MELLMKTASTGIRKMIIRGIKAPYSKIALAFLGKRLRDMSPEVVTLIFDQLTKSKTELKDFPTPEARMLVLTQGLTSPKDSVRNACAAFIAPTIQDDFINIFKLINCKLTFENQYFSRLPYLLVLVTLQTIEDENQLVFYLRDNVMAKLKKLVSTNTRVIGSLDEIPEVDESNCEMESLASQEKVDISFEEIFLLRLTFEINTSTAGQRKGEYLDCLDSLRPDFYLYREILDALTKLKTGDNFLSGRALLCEWVKFALSLTI
jgi:hypothetical protein